LSPILQSMAKWGKEYRINKQKAWWAKNFSIFKFSKLFCYHAFKFNKILFLLFKFCNPNYLLTINRERFSSSLLKCLAIFLLLIKCYLQNRTRWLKSS
jgi:hypothetical protein